MIVDGIVILITYHKFHLNMTLFHLNMMPKSQYTA